MFMPDGGKAEDVLRAKIEDLEDKLEEQDDEKGLNLVEHAKECLEDGDATKALKAFGKLQEHVRQKS